MLLFHENQTLKMKLNMQFEKMRRMWRNPNLLILEAVYSNAVRSGTMGHTQLNVERERERETEGCTWMVHTQGMLLVASARRSSVTEISGGARVHNERGFERWLSTLSLVCISKTPKKLDPKFHNLISQSIAPSHFNKKRKWKCRLKDAWSNSEKLLGIFDLA